MINTLAAPIELAWQSNQLVEMAALSNREPRGQGHASVDLVLAKVRAAVPGMTVLTLAFPGSPFSTPNHYAAFLIGDTPLTSRILDLPLLMRLAERSSPFAICLGMRLLSLFRNLSTSETMEDCP